MKYLGLHKLIWAVLVLVWLLVEMTFIGICYVIYIIWNFKLPKNFWFKWHYRETFGYRLIVDRNPWQTYVRRYNYFNE